MNKLLFGCGLLLLSTTAVVAQTNPVKPDVYDAWPSHYNSHTPRSKADIGAEMEAEEGRAALNAGDFTAAEADFSASVSSHPDGYTYLGLAEALTGQGKTAQALQSYEAIFHPDAHHAWGGTYMLRVHLEYALLLNQTGRWAEALNQYQAALPDLPARNMPQPDFVFVPATPRPVELEASARIGLGLYDTWNGEGDNNGQAMHEYTKALQLQPNWAVANYYYGYGWQHLDLKGRARAAYAPQAKAALQKAASLGGGDVKKNAEEALKAFAPPK